MEYVRFGELYKIPSCNGLSRPSAVRGEGYKMVNMGELFSNDIINDMYMERVQMNEREKKKFLLEKGDLLFARQSLVATGAGKCSVVNNLAEKTTFESHLIRVRLDETKANPLYYYYLFQLSYNPVKTIVNQCAQAGIRGTELVRIKVPLPNIEYQNTIANALFQYDKLIENNNKRIKLLEQMAENLYKEWFVRFRFPGYEDIEVEEKKPRGWQVGTEEKKHLVPSIFKYVDTIMKRMYVVKALQSVLRELTQDIFNIICGIFGLQIVPTIRVMQQFGLYIIRLNISNQLLVICNVERHNHMYILKTSISSVS